VVTEPLDRLRRAPLELLGRIVESSNAIFLVKVGEVGDDAEATDGDAGPLGDVGAEVCVEETGWDDDEGDQDDDDDDESSASSLPPGLKGVYKPQRGERPLWDFPEGLYRREIAAYELAVALGWDLIPATVERDDVLGIGSVQRFVEADFSEHYFTLRDEDRYDAQLRRMCLFDLLVNNTDRKAGHVLVDAEGHIWGIDNGLCFSTEARLRTVIWDYADEPIPDGLMDAVVGLLDRGLPDSVADHLLPEEIGRLDRRARMVRSSGRFPHDPTGRAIPWPLV